MEYLLDTNTCVYILKKRPSAAFERFRQVSYEAIGISMITWAEMLFGAAKSAFPEKNEQMFREFIAPLNLLPFEANDAWHFGQIRATLERKGTPIGPLDLLIAAHARSRGLTLVTNNEREFRRVEGLRVENWAAGE